MAVNCGLKLTHCAIVALYLANTPTRRAVIQYGYLPTTNMKMLPEHFEHLRARLATVDTDFHRGRYANAGYTTKRYQWDAVRYAGLMPWLCDTLYKYLNDDHIQTALNKIIHPLA